MSFSSKKKTVVRRVRTEIITLLILGFAEDNLVNFHYPKAVRGFADGEASYSYFFRRLMVFVNFVYHDQKGYYSLKTILFYFYSGMN